MGLLVRFLATLVAVLIASRLLPGGVVVESIEAAVVFALVLAVLNAVVRPVLVLLTLPITCLTLGLFHLVLNALLFALAAWLVPGVDVAGFLAALAGALIVSIVSALAGMVAR